MEILPGLFTLTASDPTRMFPFWTIRSLEDILVVGSLNLTASEPTKRFPNFGHFEDLEFDNITCSICVYVISPIMVCCVQELSNKTILSPNTALSFPLLPVHQHTYTGGYLGQQDTHTGG